MVNITTQTLKANNFQLLAVWYQQLTQQHSLRLRNRYKSSQPMRGVQNKKNTHITFVRHPLGSLSAFVTLRLPLKSAVKSYLYEFSSRDHHTLAHSMQETCRYAHDRTRTHQPSEQYDGLFATNNRTWEPPISRYMRHGSLSAHGTNETHWTTRLPSKHKPVCGLP
jgi:hypothetical protein